MEKPPFGISIVQAKDGATAIVIRKTRLLWPPVVSAGFTSLTICAVVVFYGFSSASPEASPRDLLRLPMEGWIQLGSLFFLIFFNLLLIWQIFGFTIVRLYPEELKVVRFGRKRKSSFTVPRSDVQSVVQGQTGGNSTRLFAEWSVGILDADERLVVGGQGYKATRWLGHRIAEWAEVPFKSAG